MLPIWWEVYGWQARGKQVIQQGKNYPTDLSTKIPDKIKIGQKNLLFTSVPKESLVGAYTGGLLIDNFVFSYNLSTILFIKLWFLKYSTNPQHNKNNKI